MTKQKAAPECGAPFHSIILGPFFNFAAQRVPKAKPTPKSPHRRHPRLPKTFSPDITPAPAMTHHHQKAPHDRGSLIANRYRHQGSMVDGLSHPLPPSKRYGGSVFTLRGVEESLGAAPSLIDGPRPLFSPPPNPPPLQNIGEFSSVRCARRTLPLETPRNENTSHTVFSGGSKHTKPTIKLSWVPAFARKREEPAVR